MRWLELAELRESRAAKLWNLRRAKRRGLAVPATWFADAAQVPEELPAAWPGGACIVRSASFAEDTAETTAAGRFESVAVEALDGAGAPRAENFAEAVQRVAKSVLEAGPGFVFLQPLIRPERGGVAFFDGFWFERAEAPGGNQQLTSGEARGEVFRGHLERDDAWSEWLERLARVFGQALRETGALDIEYAVDGTAYTLLQARPAPFAVRRNPLLSLANHREILGPAPSPWIVSALIEAGGPALDVFARIDPEVGRWGEAYAVRELGRAWLNFSFFFRLMDRWGLPRSFVTDGVGGEPRCEADGKLKLGRFLRSGVRLNRLQFSNLKTIRESKRALSELTAAIGRAQSLPELHALTVRGLDLALRTNFAINGVWTGVARVRGALRLRGRVEVVTERMQREYDALRGLSGSELELGLDAWIKTYGHRGPLESDVLQPRFSELRDALLADLAASSGPARPVSGSPRRLGRGPIYAIDRRRESFRDDLMRVWLELRMRILEQAEAAGLGDAVFYLEGEALSEPADRWPERAASGRAHHAELAQLDPPHTETLDRLREFAERPGAVRGDSADPWRGIALGDADFAGVVRRADDLIALLRDPGRSLDAQTVLVVPALEPSWAVVFGRVGAVVTELGGELSHASILLREAGVPAIVNVPGARDLRDGERVRLDAKTGRVLREAEGC